MTLLGKHQLKHGRVVHVIFRDSRTCVQEIYVSRRLPRESVKDKGRQPIMPNDMTYGIDLRQTTTSYLRPLSNRSTRCRTAWVHSSKPLIVWHRVQ
jgi:hypothetical protein